MTKFVLDTNASNQIVKEDVAIADFSIDHEYFITSLQESEIESTNDPKIRRKLLDGLRTIENGVPDGRASHETFIWGMSPWGELAWAQDGGHFERLLGKLRDHPGRSNKRGNRGDALLIEVCLLQGHTLVSNDAAVQSLCQQEGVPCLSLLQLLSAVGPGD